MTIGKELRALDAEVDAHRARISAIASRMAGDIRRKAVSPSSLLVAGTVGVVIEQGSRHRVSSLADTLTALQVYGVAAFAVLDWISSDNTA